MNKMSFEIQFMRRRESARIPIVLWVPARTVTTSGVDLVAH